MRLKQLIFLVGLAMPCHAPAIEEWQYKLELEYGLRADQLGWNIAGNLAGTQPNIISELQWRQIGLHEARLGFRFIGDKIWYLKGYANQSWGFQGNYQESDYNGDNRQLGFSRSSGAAERSSTEDVSIAIGQQIRLDGRFGITPLIGFSSHGQHVTIDNGQRTLCDASGTPYSCDHGLGPIAGLNSHFSSHWRGPWLGLDLRFAAAKRWTAYAELEYHYSYYDAQANLNLRSDLQHPKSQSQTANGRGIHMGLGLSYARQTAHSFFNIGITQKYYATRAGIHRLHFTDGTLISQRLNEVNWSSHSIIIGITSQY